MSVLFQQAIEDLEHAISCSTEARFKFQEALIWVRATERIVDINFSSDFLALGLYILR